MMKFYINKNTDSNPNHDHEVHCENCLWLPNEANREYLGEFDNCIDAIQVAKTKYSRVDGCMHCCPQCHNH